MRAFITWTLPFACCHVALSSTIRRRSLRTLATIHAHVTLAARNWLEQTDATRFAANAACVNRKILLSSCSNALRRKLEERGYTVIGTPLHAFLLSVGSACYLTLRLDHGSKTMAETVIERNTEWQVSYRRADSALQLLATTRLPSPKITMLVGTVDSLWRYPIKSMAGEALGEAFFGYAGIYSDRIYGFINSVAPTIAPLLTARDCREMVRYRPRFRNPALALMPPNQSREEQRKRGLSPLHPDTSALMVDVETPTGEVLTVDDPMLLAELTRHLSKGRLSLVCSDRAMTDCHPVSLISLQTLATI